MFNFVKPLDLKYKIIHLISTFLSLMSDKVSFVYTLRHLTCPILSLSLSPFIFSSSVLWSQKSRGKVELDQVISYSEFYF